GALGAPARGLSRGTLDRLAIARALLGDPDVVLLDEPFASLDQQGRDLAWRALRCRLDDGCSVVLTTHDRDTARRCDLVVRPAT
ncbi:MAG: ATP-binding cassette domain-containing protein, partial [Candidatus Eisenbacteria bacterium]|nr:ATP-binding cassette domain-containing protein [Candidatus Eisenbacteria bacterium]